MNRRGFIGSLAALVFAQSSRADEPLEIFRPSFTNSPEVYTRYALAGTIRPADGPLTFKLSDDDRQQYMAFRPENPGASAKLIVFSHGVLTEPAVYLPLMMHWVSHGFVVIAPVHDDTVLVRGLDIRQEGQYGASTWNAEAFFDVAEAVKRAETCSKILDYIPEVMDATGLQIDFSTPVIAGHDLGAYVAQMLLGASQVMADGERSSIPDARFYAGILLSSQGAGVMGLDDRSWATISAPLLVINGSKQADFTGLDLERRWDPFRLSKAGHKYRCIIDQAVHRLPATRPDPARHEPGQFDDLAGVSALFLKTYAFQDEAALTHLYRGIFERSCDKRIAIEAR